VREGANEGIGREGEGQIWDHRERSCPGYMRWVAVCSIRKEKRKTKVSVESRAPFSGGLSRSQGTRGNARCYSNLVAMQRLVDGPFYLGEETTRSSLPFGWAYTSGGEVA